MKKYIAFQCTECRLINVVNKQHPDGHRCKECKGMLKYIGDAVVDNKSLNIEVGVDTTEVDNVLKKVTRLHNQLTNIELKMFKLKDIFNG